MPLRATDLRNLVAQFRQFGRSDIQIFSGLQPQGFSSLEIATALQPQPEILDAVAERLDPVVTIIKRPVLQRGPPIAPFTPRRVTPTPATRPVPPTPLVLLSARDPIAIGALERHGDGRFHGPSLTPPVLRSEGDLSGISREVSGRIGLDPNRTISDQIGEHAAHGSRLAQFADHVTGGHMTAAFQKNRLPCVPPGYARRIAQEIKRGRFRCRKN